MIKLTIHRVDVTSTQPQFKFFVAILKARPLFDMTGFGLAITPVAKLFSLLGVWHLFKDDSTRFGRRSNERSDNEFLLLIIICMRANAIPMVSVRNDIHSNTPTIDVK
jgi:hypothetical protein